mgnify:CR=1 FL=1
MTALKNIHFIINPKSGTGKQKGIESSIEKILDKNEFHYEILYTERQGHATDLAKSAVDLKVDIVIAVGGDGTVNEVAKGIVGSNTALGVVPCGSGNGLARHLGVALKVEEAIAQINTSSINTMDSCLLNGEFFLNVSGVGFDAHIAQKFDEAGKRGLWTYGQLIIKEWFSYKAQNYRIQTEGLDIQLKSIFISFANGTQYGNDVRVAPLAVDNDGMIDLCVLEKFPKILTPILVFFFMINRFYKFPYVKIYRAQYFDLELEGGLVHLDGEPRDLGKKIHIEVLKDSLKVLRA